MMVGDKVDWYRQVRAGHDYYQDIVDDEYLSKTPELDGKSLFILTHIGFSEGPENYTKAIKSALSSQFAELTLQVTSKVKNES